ncbi:hypothetical protein TrCOL_g3856 [Triparma columacea]|uniref:Uncharacterized protein n=1 Tax=Triparma columacea TaxID=722753 RepID=A0A9W7GE50_9STRA|nr:hypothetical protein TrCOL_g3856 [Triparma columacea]
MKEGKAAAGKEWGGKFKLKIRAWFKMFEVIEDGDNPASDGFIDVDSLRIAMGDLMLWDRELVTSGEFSAMVEVLDNFRVGHINCDLATGYLGQLAEARRASRRAGMGLVSRVRSDVKCWGASLKVTAGSGSYIRAARRSLLEQERKRFFVRAIEAFRGSEKEGVKPRVKCEGCLRPFPYHTRAAQRHMKSGGCALRPSLFLPQEEGGVVMVEERGGDKPMWVADGVEEGVEEGGEGGKEDTKEDSKEEVKDE